MSEASNFMLCAVQEWGDPEPKRIAAVQAVLDSAGFDATATCAPVFGGIWPDPCEGPEAEAATAWLQSLTDTMERGKYEREVEHVQKFIDERKAA